MKRARAFTTRNIIYTVIIWGNPNLSNLENCSKKLLFTEFRNKNLTKEELENKGIIRVNNWLDVKYSLEEKE